MERRRVTRRHAESRGGTRRHAELFSCLRVTPRLSMEARREAPRRLAAVCAAARVQAGPVFGPGSVRAGEGGGVACLRVRLASMRATRALKTVPMMRLPPGWGGNTRERERGREMGEGGGSGDEGRQAQQRQTSRAPLLGHTSSPIGPPHVPGVPIAPGPPVRVCIYILYIYVYMCVCVYIYVPGVPIASQGDPSGRSTSVGAIDDRGRLPPLVPASFPTAVRRAARRPSGLPRPRLTPALHPPPTPPRTCLARRLARRLLRR
jgi:hypothetical protein